MQPGLASTLNATDHAYGMMGIGNFAPGSFNDINATPVDAKLDIDGDLRIREVTRVDTLNAVLVIDTNDLNRVHWRAMDDVGNAINERLALLEKRVSALENMLAGATADRRKTAF
jgi:hypothetical protein